MGILNVTPDSFSDGGRFLDRDKAVERGLAMAREGADIIDVGGESTRPGALPVPPEEEADRVVPVIRELAAATKALLSVDTRKAAVARRALEAGAHIVNDVSALAHDPAMPETVRDFQAGAVLMHMQGEPATMQNKPAYDNVVDDVERHLEQRLEAATAAGVAREALAVDPGIGFGKTLAHNLRLLAGLDRLRRFRRPIVIGVSRKSFIGRLTGREAPDRLAGSLAAMTCAVLRGAHVARVHDVQASLDAIRIVNAITAEDSNHGMAG